MLDLLFVGFFQAVSGEPVQAPATPATEQTAPATAPAEQTPQQTRRCRTENVTASRVRRQRVCTTPEEDEAIAQRAYDWMRQSDNAGGPGLSEPSTRGGSSGSGG